MFSKQAMEEEEESDGEDELGDDRGVTKQRSETVYLCVESIVSTH